MSLFGWMLLLPLLMALLLLFGFHRKLPDAALEVPSSVAFVLVATDLARSSANPDCAAVRDADATPDNKLDADSFVVLLLGVSKKRATLPRSCIPLPPILLLFIRSVNVDVDDDDTNAGFENTGNVA